MSQACYWQYENERVNEQKATVIDHESFTPIILSTAGQKGNAAKVTYKQLISLIAIKYT